MLGGGHAKDGFRVRGIGAAKYLKQRLFSEEEEERMAHDMENGDWNGWVLPNGTPQFFGTAI